MSDNIFQILAGVAIGVAVGIFVYRKLAVEKEDLKTPESFLMFQNQLVDMARTLDGRLAKMDEKMEGSSRHMFESVQRQSMQSNDMIRDVTERLAHLNETNSKVVDFAGSLKGLEQILTNQKKRGSLGEAGLELILSNMLPPTSYKMQYEFENGEKVDAAVMVRDKILPIDAKFSLENYRRIVDEKDESIREMLEKEFKNDLKKRIDETAKYVRPVEGTLDFAFMFIPAEGIYYDLLVNEVGAVKVNTKSLIEYAFREKKVIIVSPTTFAAYLQTVLHGLNALKIAEEAKDIIKRVGELGRHLSAYEEYMKKMGGALGVVVSHYNSTYREFKKIDKDVLRISGEGMGVETKELYKPSEEV